jgi:uncharacterized protein (DUF2235 family)
MLIAFDGTWNKNQTDDASDTNVVKFSELYDSDKFVYYWEGPGTRKGWLGKLIGGAFGAGGQQRIAEALREIQKKLNMVPIDIVGYSRGAAMAIDLCNQLAQHPTAIHVRFLGLFDTVASFGWPWNMLNLGYNLHLPHTVSYAAHAMAIHETRNAFKLIRLEWQHKDRGRVQWTKSKIVECWFRGVHSDIGGGNANVGLSSYPLYWMCENAILAGVKLKHPLMDRYRPNRDQAVADISPLHGLHTSPRTILATDRIHESVPLDRV